MEEPTDMEPTDSYEAEYDVEVPIKCPKCQEEITSVHVARLLRSKVNFTSTLPRRGQVILCSQCRGVLSANLGGI